MMLLADEPARSRPAVLRFDVKLADGLTGGQPAHRPGRAAAG